MKTTLKPCPFCAGRNLCHSGGATWRSVMSAGEVVHIICVECGAMGPGGERRDGADRVWNDRRKPGRAK